ncbi:caveolin-3-like [Watersipora subatra]|uniref:caveolin-3-like n=1 Tax=Watersipora subatra TaxID=2589382 RepID=UPI00355C0CD1
MGEEDGRPDLVNRDPNSVNGELNVRFEDIFGEPDGAHSPECAWKCGFKCYEGARNICYIIISALCTWLCGCCWGCDFACMTFTYIWCCTPTIQISKLICGSCETLYSTFLNCCIGPLCSAIGLFFSNIKVQQA